MLLTCLTICAVQMVAVIKALMASAFQEPVTEPLGKGDLGHRHRLLCLFTVGVTIVSSPQGPLALAFPCPVLLSTNMM